MIDIYVKNEHSKIIKVDDFTEKDCWVKVTAPTRGEINTIVEECDIPVDFLTDPLDIDERSRIEVDDNATLIVFRASVYDEEIKPLPFYTLPIGIIIRPDKIITVCSREIDFFENFIFDRLKNFSTAKKSRFMLQIFHASTRNYLAYLKLIKKRIENIEQEFEESHNSESVRKLKNIENNLYPYISSMRGNSIINDRLNRTNVIEMFDDDEDLLEDVIIDATQAIEMGNIYMHNIKSLGDYFAAMISNRLNSVMKFLTSITIVLMFPTLVASIFGMNVGLPLENNPIAFTILMSISFGGSLLITCLFIKRDWF